MSPRRFHVTYETITPESAENGDYADIGFVDARDERWSVHNLWGGNAGLVKHDNTLTLREAVRVFGERFGPYGLEANYPASLRWADTRASYRTGCEESRALHAPDNITLASFERLRRLLEGKP